MSEDVLRVLVLSGISVLIWITMNVAGTLYWNHQLRKYYADLDALEARRDALLAQVRGLEDKARG